MTVKIVAEIGASHRGSIGIARVLMALAKEVRADAVKIQIWDDETMASDYIINRGTWSGWNIKDLYRTAKTPWEWVPELFDYAKEIGIEIFSSVFDKKSVDYLEKFDCPRYKIASAEISDLDLISYVAQTRQPMIISTGMATRGDIWESYSNAIIDCPDLTFLHCTSDYPTDITNVEITRMKDELIPFCDDKGISYGLSDHTRSSIPAVMAVAVGATMIEKHISASKSEGLDDGFALHYAQWPEFVSQVRQAELCMRVNKHRVNDFYLKRSLHAACDIKAGTVITKDMVCTMRPNTGIAPSRLYDMLSKNATAVHSIIKGDPIKDYDIQLGK